MSWLRDAVVPQELHGAPPSLWVRHPSVVLRATLLLAFLDLTVTCRHLRTHPDAPDFGPVAPPVVPSRLGLPQAALHPVPTSADPGEGRISLADALEGVACPAAPVAVIETSMGTLRCDLWPDRAPTSVAWFAALARGRRDFWDPLEGAWTRAPFYDGTVFHVARSGRWIQGGDRLRTGDGAFGFSFADENTSPHDRAGLLCMGSAGPNDNRGQFAILVEPRPSLDGRYPIFGRCGPTALVDAISEVPVTAERPRVPVFVRSVRIGCREGAS